MEQRNRVVVASRLSIRVLIGYPQHLHIPNFLPTTLAEIEKQAILSALRANAGHHTKTADQLGISLRTLQYRLKEYGG